MTSMLDELQREFQNKIIEIQRIILQKGICDDTIGTCSRKTNRKMWKYLGFPYCEKGNKGENCLFGGYLEKMIHIRLWNKIPFYKAITWEYDPQMENFRLLEIIGKPWTLKNRGNKVSERNFIYSHYKGRVGIIYKKEAKLLERFLNNNDRIDVKTLYEGFESASRKAYVYAHAGQAFGDQTGIGLRLDYISGFRKKEGTITLMLLFYDKSLFKEKFNIPEKYNDNNENIKALCELAKTISYFATSVIISEILQRKIYGRTFSLTTKDFQ